MATVACDLVHIPIEFTQVDEVVDQVKGHRHLKGLFLGPHLADSFT